MSNQETAIKVEELQRRMAVQYEVEQAINELIRDMRELVDKTNIARSQMDKSQMSNLLAVALDTPSAELVKTYIQYQVGRDTGGKSWRYENFGEALVARLDKLRQKAGSIAREVYKNLRLSGEPALADIDAVWMDLTRHYLGQLNRYFYYRKGV